MTSTREKVEHVRKSKQTRNHTCHWPGCAEQVPPAHWGCLRHWKMLPSTLRDKVWKTYRPGQEEDGRPSYDYLSVANEIQKWIINYERLKKNASNQGKERP